jgi:phenylacetic acid degradation operon negative regulatory protein
VWPGRELGQDDDGVYGNRFGRPAEPGREAINRGRDLMRSPNWSPADAAGDTDTFVELPRFQVGSSPQHLVTTLLGDYWLGRPEHLPSAALVGLLGEFDVSATGARAALSRLARRGVLVASRQGRNSFYGIAPSAVDVLAAGAYRFVSFGQSVEQWDGHWTLVSFSLSEQHSELRYPVRSHLRWLGFAPLYDGLWVSPRPVAEQTRVVLTQLGLTDVTVFRAVQTPGPGRHPIKAWDLDDIEAMYSDFVDTYTALHERIERGDVSAAAALDARTRIMDSWRGFPGRDPDLPRELLPRQWPRAQAHDLFVEIYDTLGPLAAFRVQQIIERFSPELARLVVHRGTADLLRIGAEALGRQAGAVRA